MKRTTAFALALASLLMATAANAQSPRDDTQAPRAQDQQAPRGQDETQAPRGQDETQAPRGPESARR